MDFKNRIEEKGLKQLWVANQMGVSKSILNRWLTGSASMPLNREEQLKAILK